MFFLVFSASLALVANSQTTEDCGHPQFDCDFFGPGIYADPYNCKKYWECGEGGQGFHHTCEDEFLFDAHNKWCDFPDVVDCETRPICDDPCDKECHMQPTKPVDPDDCSEYCKYPNGDFEMGCCKNYFCKCNAGKGSIYPCHSNLVFVERYDACDWTYNVACCNSG